MSVAPILEALAPLVSNAAAALRLRDHFGELRGVGELEVSYHRARGLIATTPYDALRAFVDQAADGPVVHALAALVDWRLDDVVRWSSRPLLPALAAAGRAGDPAAFAWLRARSREAASRPAMPRRPPSWIVGNEAWLVLVEHGRLEPGALTADLARFWTAGEDGRGAYGRVAALPPGPRERLDRALAPLLREGPATEAQRFLLSDYGPTRADALVPGLVAAARPRDMDFAHAGTVPAALASLEAADEAALARALASLPAGVRLCAAKPATPSVARALAASFASDEAAPLLAFLREPFPPAGAVPEVRDRGLRAGLVELALGAPGERVDHGLMPSRATKLARLVLAANGHWPEKVVVEAARRAYVQPSYAAHDAVACLLAAPLGEEARRRCLEEIGLLAHRRGWRLRRKWHRLLRWRGTSMTGD